MGLHRFACTLRLVAMCVLVLQGAGADEVRFERRGQWRDWQAPEGAIELHPDGRIELGWFGMDTDPMDDMSEFVHGTRRSGRVAGGLHARSNDRDSRFLADNDPQTWWQPDRSDRVDDVWVGVDLGRVVLLKQIGLVFPDTLQVRPFLDFSVFVSEGSTVSPTEDVWRFQRVYTTTRPNRERSISIPLTTIDPPGGGGARATGDNLTTGDTLDFRPVQYIRFVPHEIGEGAALAELEAVAIGDNVAPGTWARRGGVRSGRLQTELIFDGTVDQAWNPSASRAAESFWQDGGNWFEWDLGVVFWLSRIVIYSWPPTDIARTPYGTASGSYGHNIEISDGTPIARDDPFRGPFDYKRISLVNNVEQPRRWIFDHQFGPERGRYLFWNHEFNPDGGWGFLMLEAFVYSAGYPAVASLTSDFIDLGGAKNIGSITWEAETPPGTRITVESRTGDELAREFFYYKKNGEEVSEAQYNKLPKAVRGDIVEVPKEGPDWSGWSEPHLESAQTFQSPSPRRLLKLRVNLETDDPRTTPVLQALAIQFQDALVQKGVRARIHPREARAGEWQSFRYVLQPSFTVRDRGFDRIAIPVPGEAREVAVTTAGQAVADAVVEARIDTLVVSLPRVVLRDSVEVHFEARPLSNPTRFLAVVSNSALPGNLQEVRPPAVDDDGDGKADRTDREALFVFLPEVLKGGGIRNLTLSTPVLTPNGDDLNDDLRVTFDVLRTDIAAELRLYDLAGRLLRTVIGTPGATQELIWDGRDENGLVPPGLYVLRIEIDADASSWSEMRLVSVAY